MNFAAIIHEPKSKMSYSYDEKTIHVRIKVAKNDAKRISIRAVDPFNWIPSKEDSDHYVFDTNTIVEIPMIKECETEYHDVWFAEVKEFVWSRIRYGFVIENKTEKYFYGSHYVVDLKNNAEEKNNIWNYYNFPYINTEDIYQAPEWVEDTVWYQIFPYSFSYDKTESSGNNHGTLRGVIKKLDYLKEVGINGIYLTPIFQAESEHKYDTRDYFKIDSGFGSNEDFAILVKEAHERGIRIMLDAVFNHCGHHHPFWQDVIKKGKESEYYDFFYIVDDTKAPNELIEINGAKFNNFKTFGYVAQMPKWNTGNPKVREYLLDAATYWIEKYHIDGWRLDVANEIPHDFWRVFRKRVKELNPDLYLLGENWDHSMPWLGGDQFDAVMNYEFMNQIWNFIGSCELGKERKKSFNAQQFKTGISELVSYYPKPVQKVMFNMLDSHDTARIMSICCGNLKTVMLAYVIQMTFAGAPSIYYGSELGLDGMEENNRRFMPWNLAKADHVLIKHIQRLIMLRKTNPCLKSTNLQWLTADNVTGTVIYKKSLNDFQIYVIIHNHDKEEDVILPDEMRNKIFQEIYREERIETTDNLKLKPYEFFILSMTRNQL